MLAGKQEEFKTNIYAAISEVGADLMEQRSAVPTLKNFRSRPGFKWPTAEFNMELMRPPTISQKFTWYVVEEKLRRSLEKRGIINLKFEFAIAAGNTTSVPELKSKGFMKELEKDDSVNSLTFVYPFQPPAGSDLENLVQDETMFVLVPDVKKVAIKQIQWMILGAGFFTLMIIAAFYVTVSALLRQKKMSEIKNDFINNMTHEFKTPLATISLAVDALRNDKVIEDRNKMNYFSGIIKEENKRMNKHVETILQAALMERQELQLTKAPLNVHELITDVISNYTLQLQEIEGRIELNLNARNEIINGDEVHFRNLISNLIDNAVKYSKGKLVLKISSTNSAKNLVIKFEDNGI